MTQRPTHAVLRDGARWEGGQSRGLEALADGTLVLASLPGSEPGVLHELARPWEVEVGGIAVGADGSVYVSDAGRGVVRRFGAHCGEVLEASGFDRPAGLLVRQTDRGERLLVADRGGARVVVLRTTSMTRESIHTGSFGEPTALAGDAEGRTYLVDAAASVAAVVRMEADGRFDAAFAQAMAQHTTLRPHDLAVTAEGVLLVSDRAREQVLRFDAQGAELGTLAGLAVAKPRALAYDGGRAFVADADPGRIHVVDLREGFELGAVEGYRGPVLAMTTHEGDLLVSHAPGTFLRLHAGRSRARSGVLLAGPLDAGWQRTWERARVEAVVPTDTEVGLEVALLDDREAAPSSGEWLAASTLDTLLPPPTTDGQAASARYLWLRVRLGSDDRRTSPALLQVEATTEAASYLEALPAIYAQEDGERGFMQRWLALFRSELGDMELSLDDMARRFDPATAPVDYLGWLAAWLAFDLPASASVEQRRALVQQAHWRHTHRGTRQGLQEAIELHTGLRVRVLEAHRERRLWQLGVSSRLGFDTGLPPGSAEGIVVPDPADTAEAGGLVVGDFVVGESRPQDEDDFGEPLFDDTAHLFTVVVPAGQTVTASARRTLEEIIEADKPAHTDYHLCLVQPRMRVGFQARIGVDSIVAGPPEPMILGGVRLGYSTYLADANEEEPAGRLGSQARVGVDTILG